MDEVPANNDGTIQAIYAKTIESAVVRKMTNTMGDDLSRNQEDIKDTGVICFVNPNQNIVSSNKVIASVKEINAGLINIDKAAIKVAQAFVNMVNNIKENIKTIRFTSILEQATRATQAISGLNAPGMELS